MLRAFLLAVILVTTLQENSLDSYFLSPPLPPSAFYGQYYTTTFRVLGLDNPVFKFSNLPSCFKGYPDGTIEGTPDKVGSFSVSVAYSSSDGKGQSDIVLRVVGSVSSVFQIGNSPDVLAVNRFIVINQSSSLVFKAGNQVRITLEAANGKSPYTWSFVNLPSGMTADKSGKISGILQTEGYYSFNAICNDASGQSADAYYTFNVQPNTLASQKIIEVPNRNTPVQYDLNQIATQQIAAENAVYAAIRAVVNEKQEVSLNKEAFGKTTLAFNFANEQANDASAKFKQAAAKRVAAVQIEAKTRNSLGSANKSVSLATLNVNNAINATDIAKNKLNQAQAKFSQTTKFLQATNSRFINAQTETSQAAQNEKASLSASLNTQNTYNLSFNAYTQSKKMLSDAQDQKTQSDLSVQNAKNALNLAAQVSSNAQSAHHVALEISKKTYSDLDNANKLVSNLTQQLNDAGKQLGVAKFNLIQANNNLFVAQAKKQQADKATALLKIQSASLPAAGSNSTYIFAGCSQLAYPTISGTATISVANALGYTLASGHSLLFGECTHKDVGCKVNDVIWYDGYLKDGFIHAVSFKKYGN